MSEALRKWQESLDALKKVGQELHGASDALSQLSNSTSDRVAVAEASARVQQLLKAHAVASEEFLGATRALTSPRE